MGQISDRFLGGVCFYFWIFWFSSNQIHQSRTALASTKPFGGSVGPLMGLPTNQSQEPLACAFQWSKPRQTLELERRRGHRWIDSEKPPKVFFWDGLKGKNIQVRDSCYWVFFSMKTYGVRLVCSYLMMMMMMMMMILKLPITHVDHNNSTLAHPYRYTSSIECLGFVFGLPMLRPRNSNSSSGKTCDTKGHEKSPVSERRFG